jgi:hypothetical protein
MHADAEICAWINTRPKVPGQLVLKKQFGIGTTRAKALLALAQQAMRSPVDPGSPVTRAYRKSSITDSKPFSDLRRSPTKIRSRPGGDILEERISFLLDEYHRVRTGEIPGTIPALSAHCGVGKNWFAEQVRKLRQRHGVDRQKKDNVGRKRVWSETTTENLRHANGVYTRMASAATLADVIGDGRKLMSKES